MKIIELEISGMRSHRGHPPTKLTFTGKPLVAVVGPTGAGKSSIFEAVCFALYGTGTARGDEIEDLSTDGRSTIVVRMTFSIGPDQYQLSRTVKPVTGAKARQGAFATSEVYLRKIGEDARHVTHVDGTRNVTAKIKALLGDMDRDQFCQAVLLAQNRFAALLTPTDPGKRDDLLDSLLGLSALAAAHQAAKTTRKQVGENIRRLSHARSLLPGDPATAAANAAASADLLAGIATLAARTAETLGGLAADVRDLNEHAARLESAAQLRTGTGEGGLDRLVTVGAQLHTLSETDQRLHDEAETLGRQLEEAAAHLTSTTVALAATETERGQAGTHRAACGQLTTLRSLHEERPEQVTDLSEAQASDTDLAGRVTVAETAATAAAGAAQNALTVSSEKAGAAQTAKEAAESRSRALDDVGTVIRQLTTQGSAVETAIAALDAQLRILAETQASVAAHSAPLGEAQARLDEARRTDAAAAAGHGCATGQPCPVCHTVLPAGWEPPQGGGVPDAERERDAARSALREAETAASKAELAVAQATSAACGAVDALHRLLAGASEVAAARSLSHPPAHTFDSPTPDTVRVLGAAVAGTMETVAAWYEQITRTLAPLVTAAETAAREAEAAKATSERLATDAHTADAAAGKLRTEKRGAESRLVAAQRALAGTDTRLATTSAAVPARWAALVDLAAADPVAHALSTVESDRIAVEAAQVTVTEARPVEARLRSELAGNASHRQSQVHTPLAAARASLGDLAATVAALAVDVGTPAPPDLPDGPTPQQLAAVVKDLRHSGEQATTAAREQAVQLRGQATHHSSTARTALGALVSTMRDYDPEGIEFPTMPDADEPLDANSTRLVQQLVGAARIKASQAQADATRAAAAVPQAAALDARIGDLTEWAGDLDAAMAALRKERFPAWARRERTTALIETASELLATMTNGRYRFADGLRISDELAGTVRSAGSLSGGEKFEASLALALAVADIAGRSGVKFETLFLDEGFAGLDSKNLDRAIDAIESQVTAGHSIILITHIGAVADRIPDVLYVQPTDLGGCTAEWLGDDERHELGADLDLAIA